MGEFDEISFWLQFADSPAISTYLEIHFKHGDEALQRTLLDAVDASDCSLRQWVEALIVLSQWLEVHGLSLSIQDHLSYVACAAASGATLSDLSMLVHDFLDQYGCERALKQ